MESNKPSYRLNESYIRVATACPEVAVADISTNIGRIGNLYSKAAKQGAQLVVFPELSLTGYTIGDLVQQTVLLDNVESGLVELSKLTKARGCAMVVGLPLSVGNSLYNCAAVLADGKVQGIVPKQNLPTYKEFYEKRWYEAWDSRGNIHITLGGQDVLYGTDIIFKLSSAKLGIEICEDLWVWQPPSGLLAANGANLIANPSASPEQIAKPDYRRELVTHQSARLHVGYIYAGCDASESTADIVMSGHQLIAENGRLLAERPPLAENQDLMMADIDLQHLINDRLQDNNFPSHHDFAVVDCGLKPTNQPTIRQFSPDPFWPSKAVRNSTFQLILDLQAQGLAARLKSIGDRPLVLGLSGGLDSTLALIAAINACYRLGLKPGDLIRTFTMPAEASSQRTQSNAVALAKVLNIPNELVPVGELSQTQLKALHHDGKTEDVTFENAYARQRTAFLFNKANQLKGLVLGTGDMSEIALGWTTFNGDHMSHYNVNCSVPKTLVRYLVEFAKDQPGMEKARAILESIIDTPISPELVSKVGKKKGQATEEIIGPYRLHDFFLYYFIRWKDSPAKIKLMAYQAFDGIYEPKEIDRWLVVFLERFFGAQWKRQSAPDGVKIGSVSLSQRGDWRMAPEAKPDIWLKSMGVGQGNNKLNKEKRNG